jgi:hypothetical protein
MRYLFTDNSYYAFGMINVLGWKVELFSYFFGKEDTGRRIHSPDELESASNVMHENIDMRQP